MLVALLGQVELVAAIVDLDAETPFEMAQMFVQLSAEIGQLLIVDGLEQEIEGFRVFCQGGVQSDQRSGIRR